MNEKETPHQRSILIVEDERSTALILKKSVEGMGYTVPGTTDTGPRAVEMAEQYQPDIVLMDITLEGEMDGIDSASTINDTLNIPVIYITSSTDSETIERAKTSNPYGYIIKPIDRRELKAAIEMALLRHEMEWKIRENEQKYSTILSSIADAVIVTDEREKITFMNPAAEDLTGWKDDEVMDKNIFQVLQIHSEEMPPDKFEDDPSGSFDEIRKLSRFQILHRDENNIPVDIRSAPLSTTGNQLKGKVIILRDNTEQLKSELNLRESFQQLRRAMSGSIQAMAQTVETRDPYTAGHQRRVADLARRIAQEMGLGQEKIEGIRMAGVIHDLGKISVPAEILSKPGSLTDVEFSLIKIHPEIGYEILRQIDFPWPVANIVYQHHEHLDGSGYPEGISGDEIIQEARILTVADVVEAMASHRPYRAALGIELALNEIESHRGRFFDQDVVDTCIYLFREKQYRMNYD
jgi:PAS domain S-box-containing protein/putative nucleotidyltransferase with HDIG domain